MSGSRTDPVLEAQPGPSRWENQYEVDLRLLFAEDESTNIRQLSETLDANGVKIVNRKGWKKLNHRKDRDPEEVIKLTKLVSTAESERDELKTLLFIKEEQLEACKSELSASQKLVEKKSRKVENLMKEATKLEEQLAEEKQHYQNDLESTQENLADKEAKLQKALRESAKHRDEKMELVRNNVQLTEERKSFERKWKAEVKSKTEAVEKAKSDYDTEFQKNLQLTKAIRNIAKEIGFSEEDISEDYISRLNNHIKSQQTLNSSEKSELERKRQLFKKFNSICKLVTAEAEFNAVLTSNISDSGNTPSESIQVPVTHPCNSDLDDILGISVTPVRRKSRSNHNRKLQDAILRKKKHAPWSSGPVQGSWYCTCGSKFSVRSTLNKHIKYFTREFMFECPFGDCKEKFLYLAGLKKHLIQYHQNSELLQEFTIGCYLCGIMFKTRNEYSIHRKQIHNLQDPEKRTKLHKSSTNMPIETVNMESETEQNQSVPPGPRVEVVDIADDNCSTIGQTNDDTSTQQSLSSKTTPQNSLENPRKTLVKLITCDSCTRHFYSYKDWRNHVLCGSNGCRIEKGFRCSLCNQHFRNVKIFNVHKLRNHSKILM